MRQPGATDFASRLRKRLAGATRVAVVGVGDECLAPDRPGMEIARELSRMDIPEVMVFLAGTVPESMTGPVRKFHPDHVIFLDAAEMGKEPGTMAILQPGRVRAGLFSTHALPLPVVMKYVAEETKAKVTLIGVQPVPDGAEKVVAGIGDALMRHNIGILAYTLREVVG